MCSRPRRWETARIWPSCSTNPERLHAYSYDEWTLLHLAASRGNAEVIQLLLGGGALPIVRMDDGTTPTAMAESLGYRDVAALLQPSAATAPQPLLLESARGWIRSFSPPTAR
ncbi:hypothetical protein BH23GEM3_BH23GEM3_03490 [soil metagenome]